ncbi:MAG: hypothetical protein U0350_27490 [Caldilineaceae bacterium]
MQELINPQKLPNQSLSDTLRPSAENSLEAALRRLDKLDLIQVKIWRQMTPVQRLDITFQAYQFALDVVRITERKKHPHLSPEELAWRVTRRIQGNPRLGKTHHEPSK